MTNFSIIGGRVIDPASNLDTITDIHIAEGKILAIGKSPENFSPEQQIEAQNQIVCPGFIDLGVRLREPGAEHKATILSETKAAAAGGITTVCCPPDTNPIIDTPAVVELLKQRSEANGMAKILPIGALTQGLTGEYLAEMGTLKAAGCIGVSNISSVTNTQILRHAFEYAANFSLTVFIHPMDTWLSQKAYVHEGEISTRMGLMGIPEQAETIEVARNLLLIEMTGVKAHFARLSTVRAVQMIQEARNKGLSVSCDVSIHQLFLTDKALKQCDSQYHVMPPFRSQKDKEGLRTGLSEGHIQAICSDHQPHETDAKLQPFAIAAAGISGLDTLLPLSLKLAEEMQIDLSQIIANLTIKPAQILQIESGSLSIGKVADICIFDPNKQWTLTPETMQSSGHNSPFLGWKFKGKVSHTIINGKIIQ
ncbi:MAG: dihydroorotase [Thiomargarita sp.]|nr:dihydroorotase [Thiomargarita sp.]